MGGIDNFQKVRKSQIFLGNYVRLCRFENCIRFVHIISPKPHFCVKTSRAKFRS